jgi:hypothetical protein
MALILWAVIIGEMYLSTLVRQHFDHLAFYAWLLTDPFQALSQGCISTEADVWLYNGTLYVSTKSSSDKCLLLTLNRSAMTRLL